MSTPEPFMSRWSRLKEEAGNKTDPEPTHLPRESDAVTAQPVGVDAATAAPTETNEPSSPVFDPTSLPPIESISGGTDIRSFLQSGVPADLTRAALRRAWVADPAIRDFIGIAENQWNFNDPLTIPGFGPLTAADDIPGLLAKVMRTADDVAGRIAEVAAPAPPAALPAPDRGSARPICATMADASDGRHAVGWEPAEHGPTVDGVENDVATKSDVPEPTLQRSRRPHGSAMPE
jgi:hypothetical protein